jgi:hypothetical protein
MCCPAPDRPRYPALRPATSSAGGNGRGYQLAKMLICFYAHHD